VGVTPRHTLGRYLGGFYPTCDMLQLCVPERDHTSQSLILQISPQDVLQTRATSGLSFCRACSSSRCSKRWQQVASGNSTKRAGLAPTPYTYACAADRAHNSVADALDTVARRHSDSRQAGEVCVMCARACVECARSTRLLRLLREQGRAVGVKACGRRGIAVWIT